VLAFTVSADLGGIEEVVASILDIYELFVKCAEIVEAM